MIRLAGDGQRRCPEVSDRERERRQHEALFDNRFGTGQSTIDAIMRSTNRLLADARSWCAATVCAGAGSHRGREAWARTSSSPRSTRLPPSKR